MATRDAAIVEAIRPRAVELDGIQDVGAVVRRIGNARVVLLGEATHGTHEFYRLRAEITKRLILDRGFDAIAVEADWPDALRVNAFVRAASDADDADAALGGFVRFPRWMWRNEEVRELVGWLRGHNDSLRDASAKVGFYGLDLYGLDRSMHAVIRYLERTDAAAAREARRRYGCFDDLAAEPQNYGYSARFGVGRDCEREVLEQLHALYDEAGRYLSRDGAAAEDELFHAQQNARVVKNAESYYRIMFGGRTESWNLRDTHMADTLQQLREHLSRQRGRPAKVVVWAHNSHIGDARATQWDERGQLNLGQLVRERVPAAGETFLLGFTTHSGTVAAASDWGEPVELKRVLPSRRDSVEHLLHRCGPALFLLPLHDSSLSPLAVPRLERAIGVIYRPETERYSHYFRASLKRQFDAVVHVDDSRALTPLDSSRLWQTQREPETYPTGM